MGRQKIKGGTAVFICTVPPTFKPQRCWDIPDEILTAYLHAKNLAMPVALGFARVHNMTQVQALVHGQPIESWAVVSRHLKPEWKKPNRQAAGMAKSLVQISSQLIDEPAIEQTGGGA